MNLRYGTLSKNTPPAASSGWILNSVVSLGVMVSLGLIAVSALLNFRMGYRSADTEFDGWVYGLGASCGDVLKAISPFMAFWGMRRREWVAMAAAILLFIVFTAYSFTAALGFAAEHRSSKRAANLRDIEHHGDVRGELDRAEASLKLLGAQRSSAEVESAVVTAYRQFVGSSGKTVETASAKCTLNRLATRATCLEIAKLGEEVARAKESERLAATVTTLRSELDHRESGASSTSADPQVDAIKRAAMVASLTVESDDISYGLSFLMALFIELGSGLGLYVSTTPWRERRQARRAPDPQPTAVAEIMPPAKATNAIGRLMGPLDGYAHERLEKDQEGRVSTGALYQDYMSWCRSRGYLPYTRGEFGKQFAELANFVGMPRVYRHRTELYCLIKIADA